MPLVHLPVQSGSDKNFKINESKKHLIKDYIKIYEKLKKLILKRIF